MATKVKAGRIILVENKNQHFAAKEYYSAIWVEDEDGARNVEDIPKKKAITDFFD